ncbi:MAG TPA: hypothetical protein VE665_02100, partial [Hyphomicrobiaceae bacterium]|nr:hypothetical protein [Hyphomicrobiaceae bacterium]
MATAALEALAAPADVDVASSLRVLVMARAAAEAGATRRELSRDLAPFVSHKLSPAAWRRALARTIPVLETENFISEAGGRITLTPQGLSVLGEFLGTETLPTAWTDIRNSRLVASALGLEVLAGNQLRALSRPDGLRAAILQKAYGLNNKRAPSPARLRSALAMVALERAFGSSIKGGLGAGAGFTAKAGRLLAAQLSRRPRDFRTDSRLITLLAAEQVGAVQSDVEALRVAILRNFVSQSLAAPLPSCRGGAVYASEAPPPAPPIKPPAGTCRNIVEFAREVQLAAQSSADGWPGNRKSFISHVWRTIEAQHPEWCLTDIEFKAMLAEAHLMGHVTLAGADLKDKRNIKEFQESAVAYKNT